MSFFRTLGALGAGLIVLAAGVIYSTSAPPRYTAAASVRMAPNETAGVVAADGETTGVEALVERLATRENVLAALKAIDRQRGRKDDNAQAARREQLADSLEIRVATTTGERELSVRYTGVDPHAATQVVNQVARQIADQYADGLLRSTQSIHAAAQTEVEQARQAVREAQAALDSAIDDQLRIAEMKATIHVGTKSRPPGVEDGAKAEESGPEENPVWTELSRQLTAFEADLARLRETKTLIHPLVEAAQWRARQLRHQLQQTPRYLSDGPGEPTAPHRPQPRVLTNQGDGRWTVARPELESPDTASEQTATDAVTGPDEEAQIVATRRAELADAEARYEAAVRAERFAWERQTAAQAAVRSNVREATSAESSVRHAIEPIVLAAAVAGLIVSLLIAAGARTKDRILTDVDEARRRLSMPVVGVISTA